MSVFYFIIQQAMYFSIPLLIVALGAMYSERSGIINIGLEGIMVMGAFCGIYFIHIMEEYMSGQLLLLLGILVAAVAGGVYSLFHAFASINLKADQTISGTALNMFASAFAIFMGRMFNGVQQIGFTDSFHIDRVPVLGRIPLVGPMFFQNCYITTYIGFAIFAIAAIVISKTRFGLRLRRIPTGCGFRRYQRVQDALCRHGNQRHPGRHRRHCVRSAYFHRVQCGCGRIRIPGDCSLNLWPVAQRHNLRRGLLLWHNEDSFKRIFGNSGA